MSLAKLLTNKGIDATFGSAAEDEAIAAIIKNARLTINRCNNTPSYTGQKNSWLRLDGVGKWRIQIRHRNTSLKLDGNNTSAVVASKEKGVAALETIIEELGKPNQGELQHLVKQIRPKERKPRK